jgi:hypothetical protein
MACLLARNDSRIKKLLCPAQIIKTHTLIDSCRSNAYIMKIYKKVKRFAGLPFSRLRPQGFTFNWQTVNRQAGEQIN